MRETPGSQSFEFSEIDRNFSARTPLKILLKSDTIKLCPIGQPIFPNNHGHEKKTQVSNTIIALYYYQNYILKYTLAI